MRDSLVVGLDLTTEREVHALDQSIPQWRAKGHNGDRTLVCLHCYHGIDVPQPTVVPLVPKGRLGGKRRPHFAHPPGMAPHGGHNPETVWHSAGKHTIARWARSQPGVAHVQVESWTRHRNRRADVTVTFHDRRQVVVELQRVPITDAEWLDRHRDYQQAGVVDVWLHHPSIGVPEIVVASGQPGWMLNDSHSIVPAVLGAAHPEGRRGEAKHHARHWPACPGDVRVYEQCHLDHMRLDPTGLQIPAALASTIAKEATLAQTRHKQRDAKRQRPTAQAATEGMCRENPTAPRFSEPDATRYEKGDGTATRHAMYRVDARPPYVEPEGRDRYWCRTCDKTLTGIELPHHDEYDLLRP